MPVQSETLVAGDGLKWELPNDQSRSAETLILGTNYPIFAVLGRITASSKLKYFDPAAVDGSQTPVAILVAAKDATSADQKGAVVDWTARFAYNMLAWGPGVTTLAQRTAAILLLRNRGIKAHNQA